MNMKSFFYPIELTYYSTFFLCEAIVNRSSFNVVSTNSNDVHAYKHKCSPNNSSKNQPNDYSSTPVLP